jgi:hypothetical protein
LGARRSGIKAAFANPICTGGLLLHFTAALSGKNRIFCCYPFEIVTMSRQHWTNDKLFTRLLNNKSDKTYWDNIRELRKRGSEDIFTRCYQLATTGNDLERETAMTVLAQRSLLPFRRIHLLNSLICCKLRSGNNLAR